MALLPVFSCFLLWSLVSTATAFDITKILDQYSDYDTFNQELSKTGVAEEINQRKSVTILVVCNDAMSAVTSQKEGSIADIMRIHVVLDYYDSAKIRTLKDETTLTTLYQTTGSAKKEQGFIIVSKNDNEIKLGSAVSGSQMSAKLNKVVTSVPYDVSIIEISSPIIPSGINDSGSDQPSKSSPAESPNNSSSSSPSESPADSSSGDTAAQAPAPSPSDADAPSGGVDSSADDADADGDVYATDANAPSGVADADQNSSSSRNAIVSGVMLLASFVATL
ncbi:hypothetical protein LXL04_034345 [Taraxacum kok-saghyz]